MVLPPHFALVRLLNTAVFVLLATLQPSCFHHQRLLPALRLAFDCIIASLGVEQRNQMIVSLWSMMPHPLGKARSSNNRASNGASAWCLVSVDCGSLAFWPSRRPGR